MTANNHQNNHNIQASQVGNNNQKANIIVLPNGSEPVPMGSGIVNGLLGQGGMAIVYEIWNEQLSIKRAIKLLRPNSSNDNVERFKKEIKLTAQLDHPNIIKIHSVGEWYNLPYIEMEYISGMTLEDLINKRKALPLELCTAMSVIIAKALDYTHHLKYNIDGIDHIGLLHRDLKPGNILISREGKVRLTDFGIATPSNVKTSTSSSGKIVGSMQYLAPEQLEEKKCDTRVDIFAFGCIMYEMITGEKAFPEKNITKLVQTRLKNSYIPISNFNIDIPSHLENIIIKCLSLQKEKRYSDIKKLLSELKLIHKKFTDISPEKLIVAYATGKKKPVSDKQGGKNILLPILGFGGLSLTIILAGVYFVATSINQNNFKINSIFDTASLGSNDTTVSSDTVLKNVLLKKAPLKKSKKHTKKRKIYSKKKNIHSIPQAPQNNYQDIFENTDKPETVLSKLQEKYFTDDPITIMKKEDKLGNYNNILALYSELPSAYTRMKEVRLYKHRALVKMGKINIAYFDNTHINDGEYYLSKAIYLYNNRQYQRAVWILGIIKTSPTVLINKQKLNKDVLLYKARCSSEIFLNSNTQQNKNIAIESWNNVISEFQNTPSHPYLVEATLAIQDLKARAVE